MNLVRPILLLTTLLLAAGAGAQNKTEDALRHLDQVLLSRESYISERQHTIDSLCGLRRTRQDDTALIMEIADKYTGFNNDSALHYLAQGAKVAKGAEAMPFRWKYASLLPLNCFYGMAIDEFDAIDPDSVPPGQMAGYLEAGRQLMSYLTDVYIGLDPERAEENREKLLRYQTQLLDILPPNSIEHKYTLGEYYFLIGETTKAKVLLEEVVDELPEDSNLRARAAHHLSALARERGDIDEYTYFLALSATADALSATREVLSLQELGATVDKAGDITRAHSYLSQALANAVECGAPLRMVDASRSLPFIEQAYMAAISKSRRVIYSILVAMSVLVLVLIAGLLFLRRQMVKMERLQVRLANANRAKEVYISQFLKLCSIYMDKLNQFCKIATRKLAAGQSEELYRMTKSGKFVEEQSSEFYQVFDNAFLHIYPDFVEQVNRLLRPECRIELKSGELLNTDLRILAFMRLGIEESARIAQVLNYSLNTIYAYRNRLKSRAIDKENFEQNVMNISTVL